MCFPHGDDFITLWRVLFSWGNEKSLPPRMNDLFRRIMFSWECEICKQHPSVNITGKEDKGESSLLFSLVFVGFRKGVVCLIFIISTRGKDRLKLGKLLTLMGQIRKKANSLQYHCFDKQGAAIFKLRAFLFTKPVGSYTGVYCTFQQSKPYLLWWRRF